jgi:hypothetical protein
MIGSTHKMKNYRAGTHMDLVLFLDYVWIIMVWWWQIIVEACSQNVVKTYIYYMTEILPIIITIKISKQYATNETIRIKAHENRCVEWNFFCGHISKYSNFMCRCNFNHIQCSELLLTFVVLFTLWTIKSESSVLSFVIVSFFSFVSPSYVSSMYLLNITFFTYKLVLISLNNCPNL